MDFWDLADVIKHKETRCVGYSHVLCVLGNPLGLSVTFITVQEPMTGVLLTKRGHTANMVTLADHTSLMVDLTPDGFVSPPFMMDKEFAQIRSHFELRDKENPLKIHRMIRILDRKGLLAQVYAERGSDYSKQGKYALALSSFNDSLALDPEHGEAYCERGISHAKLNQRPEAISDFTRGIELNPKDAKLYMNRGIVYAYLKRLDDARRDLLKAGELDPSLRTHAKKISELFKLELRLE